MTSFLTFAGFRTAGEIGITRRYDPPVNTVPPSIFGSPVLGQTLTADAGMWTGTEPLTYSYVWLGDGIPIAGATGNSLFLDSSHTGQAITVRVTASNPGGAASADSTATAAVGDGLLPVNVSLPTISGVASNGEVLTLNAGTWTGSPSFVFQWFRDGVVIVGVSGQTLTLGSDDVGKQISALVTANNPAGSASAQTAPTAAVASGAPINTVAPTISGSPTVGATLTAVAGTWTGSPTFTYQWKSGGINIVGATNSTYVLTATELATTITVTVTGTNVYGSASATTAATAAVTTGTGNSITVGTAGTGFRAGTVLSYVDDFSSLDVVAPATPKGRYFARRHYSPSGGPYGTVGSGTQLDPINDVDPYWTGYNDGNRGVAYGFDNMSVQNSYIRLQSRWATTAERALTAPGGNTFYSGQRPIISSMISTAGSIVYYVSSGTTVLDFRVRYSSKTTNPAGWHPTIWMVNTNPVTGGSPNNTMELDLEASSQRISQRAVTWTNGSGNFLFYGYLPDIYDGQWHDVSIVLTASTFGVYVDGNLVRTSSLAVNKYGQPHYLLLTNHVLRGTYDGDTFASQPWIDYPAGAYMDFDYIRVWRPSTASHYAPLTTISDLNVSYQGTGTLTLPSLSSLWGDTGVTEYVQCIPNESNEPGLTNSSTFVQFPTGVSYNAGTRQVSVDFSAVTGNPGRLYGTIVAYKTDGSTCVPARFTINRGPVMSAIPQQNVTRNVTAVNLDLYGYGNVGNTVPKTFTVSGLPTGLSYSSSTYRVTGTVTAVAGTYTATVSVTNAATQTSATTNLVFVVS